MDKLVSKAAVLVVVLMGLIVARCGSDDDEKMKTLQVRLDSLGSLGDGYVYEGWLIVDGNALSAGRFDAATADIEVKGELADTATAYVLTVEPEQGDDPAPSDTHVLAGDFKDGVADLKASHQAALGDDFKGASGSFILETPSSANLADDYDQGIWWLSPPGPAAGLSLPALPAGWAYEGWIVGDDGPISTGRFNDVAMADSDAGGATAGPDDTPPFPGQDFITPAMSLVNKVAVISIEPQPDDSPDPFAFKPLVADVAAESVRTLHLQLDGLEPLGADFVYEGWLILNDQPVTAGRFKLTSGQTEVDLDLQAMDLSQASTFVLTVEPAEGDDPAPAHTHVLAGDFVDGQVSLSASHMAALGDDFSGAAGTYILETPSSSNQADDFDQGIWWLDPAGPQAGLTLPDLPAGWAYEGWIVTADGPISTGRFQARDMADDDGAGATAGPDATPPFPGQDFIDPAIKLIGATAVISIEPEPDDNPAPFAFKPLVDEVDDVAAGVGQSMTNNTDSFPQASGSDQRKMLVQSMDNQASGFPSGTVTVR